MIRILLAEDDAPNRDMLRRRLERRDCLVTPAENGAEAVRLASAQEFDVILMDVAMPELCGWDAVRELRARGCPTPILMLSAHAFAEEQQQAAFHDVQGYLCKPLQMDELMQLIGEVTAERGETPRVTHD
ncbi:MAG: response regulator [Candidatus Igneacidithiobacillus chanchocoensis]